MTTEMERLEILLIRAGIPYSKRPHPYYKETTQLFYPPLGSTEEITDVVCFPYSYGGTQGLLEIMGPLCHNDMDDVEGWMTGMEVFLRIRDHYHNAKRGD